MKEKLFTLDDYREFCKKWFPNSTEEISEKDMEKIKKLSDGQKIWLPELGDGRTIYAFGLITWDANAFFIHWKNQQNLITFLFHN